jgi:glycosyltransferase involved in cell wall biosynthesis
MLKVLHVIPAIPYGGAQRIVEQLSAEQRFLGIDAVVLSLYSHPTFLANLSRSGVPYITTGTHGPWSLRSWFKLRAILRQLNPNLVHLHYDLVWSTLLLGIYKKCPWVYHAHMYHSSRKGWKNRLRRRMLCLWADAVIGVSQSVTRSVEFHLTPGPSHYRMIYNGIRLEGPLTGPSEAWPAFMGDVPPGRPLIGMATRLDRTKGVVEFLEAIPALRSKLPEARFVLAGEGPMGEWLLNKRRELRIDGVLALPGFIENVAHFWAALDFALFTSPNEPFGLRIIEPQLAGTVVLGYLNDTGSDEIVLNGITGILLPWGEKEKLAQEAASLWVDPPRRQAMANAAKHRAEEVFSLRRMALECLDFYHQLLP